MRATQDLAGGSVGVVGHDEAASDEGFREEGATMMNR
jgi:hypothetical protein